MRINVRLARKFIWGNSIVKSNPIVFEPLTFDETDTSRLLALTMNLDTDPDKRPNKTGQQRRQ